MSAPYSPARIVGTFNSHPVIAPKQAAWLSRAGVSERALQSPSPMRAGFVVWSDPGSFDFVQHLPVGTVAERAILLLVADDDGDPIDVVAWNPKSQRLGTWRGCAWAIGQGEAFAPRMSATAGLSIWRSPMDWLQADRAGLVILRPKVAAEILCDAGPIVAMDADHGFELKRSLSRPGPRILVRERVREAA